MPMMPMIDVIKERSYMVYDEWTDKCLPQVYNTPMEALTQIDKLNEGKKNTTNFSVVETKIDFVNAGTRIVGAK